MINHNNFNILLFFMKEITTEIGYKINAQAAVNNYNLKSAACSFWITYYVYATNGNRSVSEYNIDFEVAEYSDELDGCRKIGGVRTSCLWEGYGCFSTQAFCCN